MIEIGEIGHFRKINFIGPAVVMETKYPQGPENISLQLFINGTGQGKE
jgi:hypothetical protein